MLVLPRQQPPVGSSMAPARQLAALVDAAMLHPCPAQARVQLLPPVLLRPRLLAQAHALLQPSPLQGQKRVHGRLQVPALPARRPAHCPPTLTLLLQQSALAPRWRAGECQHLARLKLHLLQARSCAGIRLQFNCMAGSKRWRGGSGGLSAPKHAIACSRTC